MANPYTQEAAAWVATEVKRLRNLSYGDLLALEDQPEHRPMETADGKPLILETQVFRDDSEQRNLRVFVDVWDPSRRISFGSIANDDFIRAPDGSFVGAPVDSNDRAAANGWPGLLHFLHALAQLKVRRVATQ